MILVVIVIVIVVLVVVAVAVAATAFHDSAAQVGLLHQPGRAFGTGTPRTGASLG
jgi:flagellar basal body-associated protein FliL